MSKTFIFGHAKLMQSIFTSKKKSRFFMNKEKNKRKTVQSQKDVDNLVCFKFGIF